MIWNVSYIQINSNDIENWHSTIVCLFYIGLQMSCRFTEWFHFYNSASILCAVKQLNSTEFFRQQQLRSILKLWLMDSVFLRCWTMRDFPFLRMAYLGQDRFVCLWHEIKFEPIHLYNIIVNYMINYLQCEPNGQLKNLFPQSNAKLTCDPL